MDVTTWSLQMLRPSEQPPRPFPAGVRLERATGITAEYARFLYGLTGGDWHWTDRLGWKRQSWLDELSVPGTEFWIAYGEGVPLGFVQLQPVVQPDGTHVEIRDFGLAGPTVLANYQARGLVVYTEEVTDEAVADGSPGPWVATGGPASAR